MVNDPVIIGEDFVRSPQDLCVCTPPDEFEGAILAVADGIHGLILINLDDLSIRQKIEDCVEAKSVCFCTKTNRLVASTRREDLLELRFYMEHPRDKNFILARKMMLPPDPKISPEFTRWMTADPDTGSIFMGTGDKKTAVLWKFDINTMLWYTILIRPGILAHPFCLFPIVTKEEPAKKDNLFGFTRKSALKRQTTTIAGEPPPPKERDILICSWAPNNVWSVNKMSVDQKPDVSREKVLISSEEAETYSFNCAIAEYRTNGNVFFYDADTGNIFVAKIGSFIKKKKTVLGSIEPGQFVSMTISQKWLIVSGSHDNKIRAFKLPKEDELGAICV